MDLKDITKKKRKQLTSQDLKRRLYEKGAHGNSMPLIKNPLTSADKSTILYVNLNSSLNKRDSNQSPKILKKTASAFGDLSHNQNKAYFPRITAADFHSNKKKALFKTQQSNHSPPAKTAMNFYRPNQLESEPSEQKTAFNSSFYKNDSFLKQNQTRMTKRLVQKMAGRVSPQQKTEQISKEKGSGLDSYHSARSKQEKDQVIQKQGSEGLQQIDLGNNQKSQICSSFTSLQEYIKLIIKNVANVDQFLYLVRRSKSQSLLSPTQQPSPLLQDNIYQLQIIDYQRIKSKDKQPNFQYYTISKKGFCHYYNGKPIEFIDLNEWLQEKEIYEKIKKLNFFSRFRRWKTVKMWIKKVVRHRIDKTKQILEEKLFILNPTVRMCIFDIKTINLEMEKCLAIISINQGSYSLESFKHCQEKTRRQASGIVQQFSRRSRVSVKKCFQSNLQSLKQFLKTKSSAQDKNFASTAHNPKDNAFQVLGFPAKMSYEHRSKLRKLTGRFVRFSYLVDFMHLNGLANIFKFQIQSFSQKLTLLQVQSQVQVHYSHQSTAKSFQQGERQRMFNVQIVFKPSDIPEYSIQEIPLQVFDISLKVNKAAEIFNPLYHIKEKQHHVIPSQEKLPNDQFVKPAMRRYVPTICDLWLIMKPTLDNIFDELSFLIKQSMTSLKYFQRWSKHRQMQKYINILQEWDDIVSQSWQINQNDNLDPISIIDNLQTSMTRIKQMIQVSQLKLSQTIISQTTQPLNVYWQNTQANIAQLITNDNIQNSAQTIEFYLTYMTQQIDKFQQKIPNSIELGIFSLSLEKMKNQAVEFMKETMEGFKQKLPMYVEKHTNSLNNWLNDNCQKLRQEIHNIDDFVRLNKSLRQIQAEFYYKKDICNDLGHVYQTMYTFKIQAKRRKQFQVQTLKSKDQLEQLLINVEQTIERKTQFFTRQVSRYHLPNLLKEIEKISDNIGSQEFESLKSSSQQAIKKLTQIKSQYESLKQKKQKCLQYLSILKLSQVDVNQLDQLEKQINARLQMWQTLQTFDQFTLKINPQVVNQLNLQDLKQFITQKRNIVKQIESTHNKSQNQVLQMLKQKIQTYFINIPLLQGFNDRLSESHWDQISQIVKEYPQVDLKKKQLTLQRFLQTEIGKQAKKIQYIFGKAKVENQLQQLYSQVENAWNNTLVKSKLQSTKYIIIANPQVMRETFNYMLETLCSILANPFSQTLRQYSMTYDLLIQYYNTFENWIAVQDKLLKVDAQCRMFDVKKLPDYGQFQNCQKIYKNVMKLFSNRNVENGVKMSKLFVNGLDQKLQQMQQALRKVEQNIKSIIQQHRRNYPPFYLFSDDKLFKIITQPSSPLIIQQTARFLFPCIERIQFQGQRISAIFNFDQQRIHKSMISTTLDIEQIMLQINDTLTDINRKNMRSCRYKAVQTNLVKLVPFYQTQYLLAINKIDFSNYTEISIDNQGITGDSLKQFYKVMKKDITEDLRVRATIKHEQIIRYDTLISQCLYHEELLADIIKKRVAKTMQFQWQSQLRFAWDEGSPNQEMNITVKHCNSKMKYGSQYIGSKSKVIANSDLNLIFASSLNETSIYMGSQYNLQRILNFIGHRVVTMQCQNSTSLKDLTNFGIGNWYLEQVCFFTRVDYLKNQIRKELLRGEHLKEIKDSLMKKNVFNVKDNVRKQMGVFLSVSHSTRVHQFRGKCRIIHPSQIHPNHIKNLLKIKGIFSQSLQINDFLLKLFEMTCYLQQKSFCFNTSIQDFLQNHLCISEQTMNSKRQIFQQFLTYVKPKVGLDATTILEETVRLYLTAQSTLSNDMGKDEIIQFGSHNHTNHSNSKTGEKNKDNAGEKNKDNVGPKRASSRSSQSRMNIGVKSQEKTVGTKIKMGGDILNSPSPSNSHSRSGAKQILGAAHLQKSLDQLQRSMKQQQILHAVQCRNIIILTGIGSSKLYCVKSVFSSSHHIIQIYSHQIQPHSPAQFQTNIEQHLSHTSQCSNKPALLYFEGLTQELLNQLQRLQHSQKVRQVKAKIKQKNVVICVAVEDLTQWSYSQLSGFYIVNVQLEGNQYLQEISKLFAQKQLLTEKENITFNKFYNQTLLATFDNWVIKDLKTKQRHIYVFLTYLKSLLPVQKLLEAMTYCFIRVFSNLDLDYIKLEFLVKKLLGQSYISEEHRVYDLVYTKQQSEQSSIYQPSSSCCINSSQQELIYIHKAFPSLISEPYQSNHHYFDYIITPQLYHYVTIMKRILHNTQQGIYILGGQNTGKTALCQIYKHLNYQNQSYLRLTMRDNDTKNEFKNRILGNMNVHSLKEIKGKVNYGSSVIIVDDINMVRGNEDGSPYDNKKSFVQKLKIIKHMLKYKVLQYPHVLPTNKHSPSMNHISNSNPAYQYSHPTLASTVTKQLSISQVNFILTGRSVYPSQLKDCTVPIQLLTSESELKSVFSLYLRQHLPCSQINELTINDISSTTYDICKKISARHASMEGLELSRTKYILSRFSHLRIKELTSQGVQKEVQKYWVYLLNQQLASFEQHHTDRQHTATEQTILFKQLKAINLHDINTPTTNLLYSYLHVKDSSSSSGKKLEYVKDIKKIFNIVNEKIQKYNDSENKRYGNSFDFIHFDQLVRKIIKISNNLNGRDYLLYGRKGSGKQSLVRLVAYLQGSNYKLVQAPLKSAILDIFLTTNITTMSSCIISHKINSVEDIQHVKQFYNADFASQILGSALLQKPTKIAVVRQSAKSPGASVNQSNLSANMSKTSTLQQNKTFSSNVNNTIGTAAQYYIAPKARLTQDDVGRYRDAVRIVLLTNTRQVLQRMPVEIKMHFNIDQMEEVPLNCLQQYSIKFLEAQQVKYSPSTPLLISQIFNFSRSSLSLSLKQNDDCIRLFSSFSSTLKQQIHDQVTKYGRILELYNQIRKLQGHLQVEVEEFHDKIKKINELLVIQDTEQRKQEKAIIQAGLHKKSNCLSKSERIIQMLSMLVPSFKDKHSLINKYILDTQYFEQSLIVAACYFTYLSQKSLKQRRKVLKKWYKNDKIPALLNSTQINSFLTLFNLYPEQFNAEPIDDIQDFYENMAIIFNSVKPVVIRDKCKKGKSWLESVCSFVVVSERQSNFIEVICENIVKPSNILIQITNQQTMNNISTSFINTLLFLGQSTQVITIKGQQIKVSPQAKFYVLLGQGIALPNNVQNQFTEVSFSESQLLLERSIEYTYMGICHPEVFYTQLDLKKKIRNLRLEREALMLEIAQNVYVGFQKNQDDDKQQSKQKVEQQSGEKVNQNEKKVLEDIQFLASQNREYFETRVIEIADKTMTRGQNLANKLKEKQQLCKDLQHKYDVSSKFAQQTKQFLHQSNNILSILSTISQKSKSIHSQFSYPFIPHQQFVKKITLGLKRGFIFTSNPLSLYLFAIKIWGPQYVGNDFYVFLLFIFAMMERSPFGGQISTYFNGKNNLQQDGAKQKVNIGIQKFDIQKILMKNCSSFEDFKQTVVNHLGDLLGKFSYVSLIPYLQYSGTISNLQQGQDRRVILNCVWMDEMSNSLEQKLQETLKIVTLQLRDMANLENQIKKYLFQENVLVISSLQILQVTLDYLKKLGGHQKIIYYKCPLKQSQIQKVQILGKRLNISEINNSYCNKNTIFAQCLQRIQKERQLKKYSSVSNIKSMKSIDLIKIQSDSHKGIHEQGRKLGQQGKKLSQLRPQAHQKKIIMISFQQDSSNDKQSLSSTINKPQRTQKNLLSQTQQRSLQQISSKLYQTISQISSLLNTIYSSNNLAKPFFHEGQDKELADYLNNCTNEEQEFTLQERLAFIFKMIGVLRKENYQLVDRETKRKLNQISALIDSIIKQASSPLEQLQLVTARLQQLENTLQPQNDTLTLIAAKANRVKFEVQFVSYFKKFLSIEQPESQISKLTKKAKQIYSSIKTINEPISVKRSSRKSINVFFRKEQIKEKLSFTSSMTSSLSSTNKKGSGIKRVSKQAMLNSKNAKQQEQNAHNQFSLGNESFLTQLLIEIDFKKLESRISILINAMETAFSSLQNSQSISTPSAFQQLQLLLLLLQDKLPGTWLLMLNHNILTNNPSLASVFKRHIRLSQDLNFFLEKIKRSMHSEIDFSIIKYPLEYIQFHFKRRITLQEPQTYLLYHTPSAQELQASEDYIKLANVQTAGWKFTSQANMIDLVTGDKPMVSEGKIMTSCYFIKKDISNQQQPHHQQAINNVLPIEVFQSRCDPKPFMKVYANCKKVNNLSALNSGGLAIYLKDEGNSL